jgi:prolyl-tRNA synthetase
LWQEGHTAHETKNEAIEETKMINDLYAEFAENFMSMPVIKGVKSKNETFAGAETTYCIEALMQDGKALQAGTSHFLGQNFAKAFDVKFADRQGKLQHVWATSWGVSSRLMGALIMTHSDDHGLVLPPKLAPFQVVIVPIYKNEDELNEISSVAETLKSELIKNNVSVKFDTRDTIRPGQKFAQHEIQGVPVRIAIGPKDLQNKTVEIARRDNLTKDYIKLDLATDHVIHLLDEIQSNLLQRALKFRNENITKVDSFEEFKEVLENKGGFIFAHWDGSSETENKIKELTKATIRCIPETDDNESGNCIFSGNPSGQRVLFAKAY